MKSKYILSLFLLLFLSACMGHEGDYIKNDKEKNNSLLIPPCLK